MDTVFLRQFIRNPRTVGSMVPSSRFLVDKMLAGVPWDRCRTVVELGPGTGQVTSGILARMPAGGSLLLFEREAVFRESLAERFPRVELFPEATQLEQVIQERGQGPVDAVLSGLPFALMPPDRRREILDQVHACLVPGGRFVAFQYSLLLLRELRERFSTVSVRFTPLNLPPAFVYTCTK